MDKLIYNWCEAHYLGHLNPTKAIMKKNSDSETPSYILYKKIGQKFKDAEESQMFGKPCFKIHSKAFVSFFEDEMVFKLTGKEHEKALSIKGAKLFDPSGKKRPMKEWVQVPASSSGEWTKFANAALKYVSGE